MEEADEACRGHIRELTFVAEDHEFKERVHEVLERYRQEQIRILRKYGLLPTPTVVEQCKELGAA